MRCTPSSRASSAAARAAASSSPTRCSTSARPTRAGWRATRRWPSWRAATSEPRAGHGRDFVWWSGLTDADARRGLEMHAAPRSETVDGLTYWTIGAPRRRSAREAAAHLLPIYDEYLIAYRDREAVPHGPVRIAIGARSERDLPARGRHRRPDRGNVADVSRLTGRHHHGDTAAPLEARRAPRTGRTPANAISASWRRRSK